MFLLAIPIAIFVAGCCDGFVSQPPAARSSEPQLSRRQQWPLYYNARIDNDYNYADDDVVGDDQFAGFGQQDGAAYFQLLSLEVNSAEASSSAETEPLPSQGKPSRPQFALPDDGSSEEIPVLEGTQENTTTTNQSGTNVGTSVAGQQCQHGTYQPSSKGCSTFQVCNRGALTETHCPTDMWFDPRHKDNVLCNYPEVVCAADNTVCECAEKYPPLPPDPLIEARVSCLADNRFHLHASEVECGRYFVCFNEHVKRMECRDGLHYNPETEACDYPEIVNCQMKDPDCPAEGVSFLANEARLDSFFFCVHGYKSEQTCPFYHTWDDSKKSCVTLEEVEPKRKTKKGRKYY